MNARLIVALLPMLMAGCSMLPFGDDDAGPAVPIAASTQETTAPIDGLYRGTGELVSGSQDACPSDSWGNIEIGDRALLYAYTPSAIFSTPVAPDGKVHAMAGNYVLDGSLVDGQLSFTVEGPSCKTAFNFSRARSF